MTNSSHDHENNGHDSNNDHGNNDFFPHADYERALPRREEDVHDDFSFDALTGHVDPDGTSEQTAKCYRGSERVPPFVGLEDIMRELTASPHLRRTFRSRYKELCMLVCERNDGLPEEERIRVPSLKAFQAEIRRLEPAFARYGINAARGMVYPHTPTRD